MLHLVQYTPPAALLIAGIIHLLPLYGAAGAGPLAGLYGISVADPNIVILMRHRAVLFGLLGAFLLLAVFRYELRTLAFAGGLLSVVTFLIIAQLAPAHSDAIQRVVTADWIALGALLIGLAAHMATPNR